MNRINFPLTIEEIYENCKKQIKEGNGKKFVLISDDEEGNGFHEAYFDFENADILKDCYCSIPNDLKLEDCVILG